jgi:hypothetical protein
MKNLDLEKRLRLARIKHAFEIALIQQSASESIVTELMQDYTLCQVKDLEVYFFHVEGTPEHTQEQKRYETWVKKNEENYILVYEDDEFWLVPPYFSMKYLSDGRMLVKDYIEASLFETPEAVAKAYLEAVEDEESQWKGFM